MRDEFKSLAANAHALRRDPASRLIAELDALGDGRGVLLRHDERRWASITFTGARHTLALRFAGDDAVQAGERFIAELPEHEFAIPRHLVADATVTAARHALLPEPFLDVDCEVLLLDDE